MKRPVMAVLLSLAATASAGDFLPFDHNLCTRETEPDLVRFIPPADSVGDKIRADGAMIDHMDYSPVLPVMVTAIRFFQVFISPQDGPACIYAPTCSQYGLMALRSYGPVTGLLMAGDRWLRCNFFGYPGYDPPEDNYFGCGHGH